jgi:hypothetical protein
MEANFSKNSKKMFLINILIFFRKMDTLISMPLQLLNYFIVDSSESVHPSVPSVIVTVHDERLIHDLRGQRPTRIVIGIP